jgi:hypothetical protein
MPYRLEFIFDMVFMKIKENGWTLALIYVFNVLLVKKISGQKQSPKSMTLYL